MIAPGRDLLPDPPITYERLHALTSPFAEYERNEMYRGQEWRILASGLIEEVLERVFGFKQVEHASPAVYNEMARRDLTPEETAHMVGEDGDIWWYISEISRFGRLSAEEILGDANDLATFQAQDSTDILPIVDNSGEELTLEIDPRAVLAVEAARVADVINPRTDALWRGNSDRPPLGEAVHDLGRASAYLANRHGLSIVQGVLHFVEKLGERKRDPAVLGEAAQATAESAAYLTSGRERLEVVPWVSNLLEQSGIVQWDSSLPKPWDRAL